MIVRRELPTDAEAVRSLFSTVYSDTFYDKLHNSDAWLPNLSFVAVGPDGEIAGHIGATRGHIGSTPALALVPPSVHPDQRGHGVGQALTHSIIGAAEALGESIIGLVATPPDYFSRFGFRSADGLGIIPPAGGWQPYFLIRILTGYDESIRGTFVFPEAFGA